MLGWTKPSCGRIGHLDGSNSTDEKGVQLEYEWIWPLLQFDSLTSADLFDADEANASFVPDVSGLRSWTRVYDKAGWSTPDYVTAVSPQTILPPSPMRVNLARPPCESGSFELNGLGSYD